MEPKDHEIIPHRFDAPAKMSPSPGREDDGELTEEDLDRVSGGAGSTNNWRCAPWTAKGCRY